MDSWSSLHQLMEARVDKKDPVLQICEITDCCFWSQRYRWKKQVAIVVVPSPHCYKPFFLLLKWLPGYYEQKLTELKGEIDSSTIIIGNFNTPLSIMARTTRQKIIEDLTQLIDLIDINRTHYATQRAYVFFSSVPSTFSRTDHILGCKLSQILKDEYHTKYLWLQWDEVRNQYQVKLENSQVCGN